MRCATGWATVVCAIGSIVVGRGGLEKRRSNSKWLIKSGASMKCSKWAKERTVEKSIKRLGYVAPSKVRR